MLYCKELFSCLNKAVNWQNRQRNELLKAERKHNEFKQMYSEGEAKIIFSKHIMKRQLDRGISQSDVQEVIRSGWPIEHIETIHEVTMLLMYHVRSGNTFRPLHVSCVFEKSTPYHWTVKTSYDPRSHEWKWENNYQKRICFCE